MEKRYHIYEIAVLSQFRNFKFVESLENNSDGFESVDEAEQALEKAEEHDQLQGFFIIAAVYETVMD